MMTDDLIECPKCKHPKALTHYSSCGLVNWIACPKCRTFFDHNVEKPETDSDFWSHVEEDTEFKKDEKPDLKIFTKEEWEYFCNKINFGASFLDAKAVRIMNKPYNQKERIEDWS